MAYMNLMEIISGNHVQEHFHDRFNIQKYQVALGEEARKKQPVWLIVGHLVRALRVKSTFRLTSVNTWLCMTSIWHSYGAARLPGVLFRKGHHRTVWTTCAGHTTHQSR